MTATTHDDLVVCGDVTIPYRYYRSRRRRTLGITVRADRSVTVRVPSGTSQDAIRAFVVKQAPWVAKTWLKLEGQNAEVPQRYDDGARFRFQGREYILKIQSGHDDSVSILGNFLVVSTHDSPTLDKLRQLIDAWYMMEAAEHFRARAIACHYRLKVENIPLPAIVIRPMKSRWGSYSYRTGRINLNLFLAKLPQECLDYVIIHELCHIKIRHHGPSFWKLVERYVPDHTHIRKLLRM